MIVRIFIQVLIVLTLLTSAVAQCVDAKQDEPCLTSPDKKVKVSLSLTNHKPFWRVSYAGTEVIVKSPLGLITKSGLGDKGYETLGRTLSENKSYFKPTYGQFSTVEDFYRQLVWKLKDKKTSREFDIIVRAYNDGIAVRYAIKGPGEAVVTGDLTTFTFAKDYTCWAANGEKANIGPIQLSKFRGESFPITLKINDHLYGSLLEAAIFDYAYLIPQKTGTLSIGNSMRSSKVLLPSKTSWRVLLLANSPGGLIESNMVINLNPECKIKDTSWIKPGLSMWDWRSWGAKDDDGFVYNLDMASWRRHIDFASKNGVKYLVLDANWYGHEFDKKSNPIKSRDYIVYQPNPKSPTMADKPAPKGWKDPIDIPALIKYGKERGIGIFLYINDVAKNNYDFEKTLATYHKWGAAGIKYGFMKGGRSQFKVINTREIVELCAKYELMCNFHDGPVPPSGDRRTYPNLVSREFCHSQCDATRSFNPTTFCTTVFCNMLAGPLDMCNGFFTLNEIEKTRPKVFKAVNSTVTGEVARVIITFSGVSILPDTPSSYRGKADLFSILAKLPMTWDETKVLHGKIGKYISIARRAGSSWFIGSSCNESGKTLPLVLDFLEPGQTYKATLFEDGPTSHYIKNKEDYKVKGIEVKQGDVIQAKLAPGGGHCVLIEKL